MIDIGFAKPALPESGALALLLAEGAALDGVAAALDAALEGGLTRAMAAARFTGKRGQTATLIAPGAGLDRVVLVGLGAADDVTPHRAESAGATAAAALLKEPSASLAADALDPALLAHAALGARLRSYRFDRYRTRQKEEQKPKLANLAVLASDTAATRTAFAPLAALAAGVELTRDLVSEPANILTPAEMADRAKTLKSLGVKVEVMDQRDLEKLGFGALLGVARGSVNEPRVVVMQWLGASEPEAPARGRKAQAKQAAKPARKERAVPHDPLVFIGKGVTFDTGGISLKPAAGMEDMKWDMAGAGTVIGLMAALAGRKARVDAVGLVGLVENMPSGSAQRPGDVVTSYSGQTIEVLNTDAEGRLVLADVLAYAQERFQPRFMIDLATLTGAIIVALGHENAGLFSNDDTLAGQLAEAAKITGEGVWRMPMGEAYDKLINCDIADMKNIGGGRAGGSITAAQFLQRFVNKVPWAHLDIAGMAWATKDGAVGPKGATGFGVRLLDRLVADHYER
ncbi:MULTISPECIES: leucyl aminopeptidase [Acidiphilium]|jgi:leucyl aminopeptidase|uniref:Probable cytosol aminopeptidase n=3 Tax=Acidiphilium TaxID=522 RepID=A5FXT4_ACICJ|nr:MULTISPECIES: leucyl aminopeptidase [Acidiphilium]MBU6356931.1 leucyl aminopeptidase [Rhodospirillales bacterium]ABQ30416.1 Leucyl aminopeptidase [Acidiphilium cryptum JF-5]KDM66801.1 putative cytosol aminopeptidase PepA [Acidiphilium sp. JA12-A1]MBS3025166.1 leucyl aminopeptidase [Acidiphilium multivorum]MDE2328646.1 leucyl aminopeptidase [Rhodospirillales bacterium]